MSEDARIDVLMQALMESDIEPAEKDALADDLEYAQKINGSVDPTLQGIKRITISGVRREMMAHARLKRHESDCVLKQGMGSGESGVGSGAGKVGVALVVIRALTPWRWPAAIAVFSPFAGDVVAKVGMIFKGG